MKLELLEDKIINMIKNMSERTLLKEIENKIFSNEECLSLISCFNQAQDEYNFSLKLFKEDHELTIQKQKNLYEAKLKMDTNPLINEYNTLLKACNEPLRYLEYKLISLFQKGHKHQC